MIENLIQSPYCYEYLVDQISVGLLVYSHIPTALIALVFGIFLFSKTKNKSSFAILILSICFALWGFLDLGAWFAFLGSKITMFTWSLLNLLSLLFFSFSYYFIYTFIKRKDLPLWQKVVGFTLLLPTLWGIFTGANLTGFDMTICEAYESDFYNGYATYLQFAFVALIAVFSIKEYINTKDGVLRKKILLASVGILLFLSNFFLTGILVGFIYSFGLWEYAYNAEIYGLFGMPVFLIFLGYLIVKYHEFNLKIFTAQAFIIALITLVAAQFAFIHDVTSIVLNTITFALVSWVGISLTNNVRLEIELRKKNETLAEHLQVANDGQANLIHIMNHQIKSYLSKSRNIFAELLEEPSYGPINESAKPMIKEGLESLTEGVGFVQQVLNGSSAETGKLVYAKNPIEIGAIVTETATKQKEKADSAGLSLEVTIDEGDYRMIGDGVQLREAIRNLIDNSIRYTPKGGLKVHLTHKEKKMLLTITDTGMGITPEDMKKLFTRGGRGKDSLKVNINSTGYGLVFVKGVVEAHGGRTWAESEGKDKGSTFYIEFPANK
ncbi:MAG: two-component system, NarL family, sensor histidine kinase BarA [Parcubacteria bacterium C7867-005]|nr:MAG: two-component system, NarL family, sensor histidine kinase BarA [Parcubacteria bacterium C7867-005]